MSAKNRPTFRTSSRVLITIRYIVVATIIVLLAGWISFNMFSTTVLNADKWIEKANKELEKHEIMWPERGDILSADGSVLATNLKYYTIRIDYRASKFDDKKYYESLDSLCDTLAHYYPIRSVDEWHTYLMREMKKKATSRSRGFALLKDLTYEQAEAVKDFPYFRRSKNPNKTGFKRDDVTRRCYPYGDMARRSIGRVGMTDKSDEVHGISGLEKALDSKLYGQPGYYKKVPLTSTIVNWTDVPAINGLTLTTTIDVSMQDIVENELSRALQEYEAEWGTVVLMEVSTGDIKAISNLERDDKGNYIESMNHAIQGFEPGSVMKTISMVIALEDGFVKNPESEYYDIPGGYKFGGGSPISDTHSPPSLPVSRFLEYSSNIGMTKLVAPHFKDDPNGFRERIRKLGFLEPLNTGIADEKPPYFPHLDIRAGGLTSLGRQTFGYASRIPPLYTCAFYNAVANDGKFVRPRLISKITTDKGDSIIKVDYINKQMCSPRTAAIVREMLHKVVYGEHGTATMLRDKLVDIAGKTGTSRIAREMTKADRAKLEKNPNDPTVVRPSGYEEGSYRFSFCGFFPYEKPQYTCMVMISRPGAHVPRNAGVTSGSVLLNIAKRMYSRGMLGTPPDYKTSAEGEQKHARPVLYATKNPSRDNSLTEMLGSDNARRIHAPSKTAKGTVPDVSGLGLREAIVVLERSGYNIAFQGDGSVLSQVPGAGTRAAPGTKVVLTMSKR